MPTWSEVAQEIQSEFKTHGPQAVDIVRRRYSQALHGHKGEGRNVILYATKWTQSGGPPVPADAISISDEDLQGFMEVVYGLKGDKLDLIIHSPGGSAEATEAIVSYLRKKFSDIRVIIPSLAMSAATMLACGANRIVLGKHSFLGPIDPQLIIQTKLGAQMAPAQAILDQFEQAKQECTDPKNLAAWLPMLDQYGPHVLQLCQNVLKLSEEVVKKWLRQYMFGGKQGKKASDIAKWLANHKHFRSHGRHISREEAEGKGLQIEHLEKDQVMQDVVLSIFHAATHTFGMTTAVKIIENHQGRAFIKQVVPIMIAQPAAAIAAEGPKAPSEK